MSSCDVIRILASRRNPKNSERFNELNEIKVIPHEEKVDLSWLDSSRRKVACSIDRGNSINEREWVEQVYFRRDGEKSWERKDIFGRSILIKWRQKRFPFITQKILARSLHRIAAIMLIKYLLKIPKIPNALYILRIQKSNHFTHWLNY